MAVARTVIPDATLNWLPLPLRAIMLPRPNRIGSVGPPELTPGSWSSPLSIIGPPHANQKRAGSG